MDAKTLAAQIRADIRRATKTEGDPLYGLRISVRKESASMMTAVNIDVQDLPSTVLIAELAGEEPAGGYGWATVRAQKISNRLHELAAPALDEADGRHSFCSIYFGGLVAPSPRDIEPQTDDAAAAHIEAQADAAVPAVDEITDPELCPSCLEVMGACDCDSESAAKEDARNEAAAAEQDDPEEYARFLAAWEDAQRADRRPNCPNGHGPMQGEARISADAQAADALGTWHTCTVQDCRESYIRPSRVLIHALGSAMGANLTPQTLAAPAAPTAEYGTRRGALAAVR